MARLLTSGAEIQSTDRAVEGFGVVGGSFSISTSVKRSGAAAYLLTDAAVNYLGHSWTNVTSRVYYARAWVYHDSLPTSGNTKKFMAMQGGAANFAAFIIDSAGLINTAFAGGTNTSTGVTVAAGAWHCYEISASHDTSTTGSAEFRIDGTTVRTVSGGSTTTVVDQVRIGHVAGTNGQGWQMYLDDVAINDSTGGDQAGFPGIAGKVLLLIPTADSAVGSDWKLGTGTTPSSNAYDSVNNTPPLGVANGTGGSDAKQIRDTVSSTTTPAANADFTMQSYSTAGVPAGATIRVLQALGVLSTNSAGASDMEVSTVSNPAEGSPASTSVTGVAGTFPANWRRVSGSIQYSPTVTLATAPVARVGKRTATTTAQLAALIGIQVEYEPGLTGDLSGTAQISFDASAPNMTGAAGLSGSADVAITTSATLDPGGHLQGASHITFAGDVVPPTATANLSSSPAITFAATSTGINPHLAMTGFSSILFAASVVPPTAKANLAGVSAIVTAVDGDINKQLPDRITGDFTARWASGRHLGAARPGMRVEVRHGRFLRRNDVWSDAGDQDMEDVFIPGLSEGKNENPWQAFWTPQTSYVDVPNVREVTLNKALSQRGLTSATITVDNIVYKAETGHHSIKRGLLAPLRGYVGAGRTALTDEQGGTVGQDATWFNLLIRQAQITVWQSYGDQEVCTFTGLVDDVDTTSRPDVLTITARCFGQILTDERVFGWNKEPEVKDPVRFEDRERADQVTSVGDNPSASTELDSAHSAANVTDGDGDTYWVSHKHSTQGNTEWVEIELPQGRYSDFHLNLPQAGMDAYVSLYAMELDDSSPPTMDGADVSVGWQGSGSVPGSLGGIPYLTNPTNIAAGGQVRDLGAEFVVGTGSLLRVSLRNLAFYGPLGDSSPWAAEVTSLQGRKRKRIQDAVTQSWVLVQDVSDVVKQILRWAGFKEWEVERAGITLQKPFVANRGMFYMDVIQKMADAIGFTFFIGDPTSDADSIGVPVFRRTRAVQGTAAVATVSDRELLTAVQVQQSDESLAYIIRVRGRESDNGTRLGGTGSRRIMYTFRPPWSHQLDEAIGDDELGGVIKHVIHTDQLFRTLDDCKFGAYYIALQEALESIKVTFAFPAWPGVDLDDHLELLDLGTGVTSRVIVTDRQSTFTRTKDKTVWVMSAGGALVDTPDVSDMVAIINGAARS